MKPYAFIPIKDCGEPLVAIPPDLFSIVTPHPYVQLRAPYGDKSPYFVRAGVLAALQQAQQALQELQPGWRLRIFDAYRPIPVQQFMVDYTFRQLLHQRHLDAAILSPEQRQSILQEVYQFWAMPSHDPTTPPPHSTGAAVDVTLADERDQPIDMGSPIDEVSPRSYPNYFAATGDYTAEWSISPELAQTFDKHRQLLHRVMTAAGFCRHPQEWWHFSLGDQMWVWLCNQKSTSLHPPNPQLAQSARTTQQVARYGAA